MFPPQKKQPGPPQGPGGPPDPFAPQGPPIPAGGPMGPPGLGAPSGLPPMGGMDGPPDPFGGMGLQPGLPKPGQGMDPMQAMTQGFGPDPMAAQGGMPQGPPMGPDGLPIGGQMPGAGGDNDGDETMGGSDLLQAIQAQLSGGGDPYAVAPGEPDQGFQGAGIGDPNMGIEQLLQMLALGQMGVGGGPQGSSGAMDLSPQGNPGQMVGY